MSFDLYFCSDNKDKITKNDLSDYFAKFYYFQQEWVYNNTNTGVYSIFKYLDDPNNDFETLVPQGYYETKLTVTTNYNRPRFFADEIMLFIERLCDYFDLLVVDPQDHEIGGNSLPKKAKSSYLIDSWLKSNKQTLNVLKLNGSLPPYLDREKSTYWWNYQYNYQNLNNSFPDSIFVPNIFLMKQSKSQKIVTALTWTNAIPFVFPNCDIVIITHLEKQGFLKHKIKPVLKGVINSELIRERIL